MLVALAHSTVPLTHQRNLSEWAQVTLLQGSLIPAGWISRKHLPSGRGRSFFLTSLLIELIDLHCLLSVTKRHFLFNDSSNVPTFESVLEFSRASPLKPSPRSRN